MSQLDLRFDGATFEAKHDRRRLGAQLSAVRALMLDGRFRTLREIHEGIGGMGSLPGISARLRDFRKAKFGGHVVERRRRGEAAKGVFEYRLILREKAESKKPDERRERIAGQGE